MMSRTLTSPASTGLTVLLFVGAGGLASSQLFAALDDPLSAFEACGRIDGDSDQLACFRETLARLKAGGAGTAMPSPDNFPTPAEGEVTRHLGEEHEVRVQEARETAKHEFGLDEKTKQILNAEPPKDRIEAPAETSVRELKEASREPQSLPATITKVRRTAFGKIVATLDNGQVWRETDGSHYRGSVRAGNAVVISQRPLGGYQMKIGDQSGVVLVRRTE
jgi:hypothetical protein